eukprot:g11.t1
MAPRADPQSWEELTSASASSGTIYLSADFEMGDYTKAIDFSNKVLVIRGNNATLDAGGKGQFFSGDGSKGHTSLELHDVVMQNGYANNEGGAILVMNSGHKPVSLILDNINFNNNTAEQADKGYGYGGAVYAKENQAAYGGAVEGYNSVLLKIDSSTFTSNTAHMEGEYCTLWSGCEFKSNSAITFGGAIYLKDWPGFGAFVVAIRATNFTGNCAQSGGAIYFCTNANGTLTGCTFTAGKDKTQAGHNDVAREDSTANVLFACANTQCGDDFTMRNARVQPADILHCTPATANYACNIPAWTKIPQCKQDDSGDYKSCSECHDGCAAALNPQRVAQEQAALDKFYQSTKGVDGWLHACGEGWPKPNQKSTPACTRHGVTCDRSQQFVVKLDLNGCGLTGTIPLASIFDIRGLTDINFASESYASRSPLTGKLPADLSEAVQLKSLTLNSNGFTGTIPDLSKLTSLQLIDLHYNDFNGSLPILASPSLNYVSFAGNAFTGTIPSSWSKLANVEILGLANNKLSGTADIITEFPKLVVVFLRNNSFVGEIPKLPNTTSVADFDHNEFSSIAADICSPNAPPAFKNFCGCKSDYPSQPFATCCFANNDFKPPSKSCMQNCFTDSLSGEFLKDVKGVKTKLRVNTLRDSIKIRSKAAPSRVKRHWAKVRIATFAFGGALSRRKTYLAIKEEAEREIQKMEKLQQQANGETDYKTDGDRTMYQPEAIMQRKALMRLPEIRAVVEEFWTLIDLAKEEHGQLTKDSYMLLSTKLHLALVPDVQKEALLISAAQDWVEDSNGKETMDFEQFFSSMFELADIWVEGIDGAEYVAFLQRLKFAIVDTDLEPFHFRHDKDIVCQTAANANEEENDDEMVEEDDALDGEGGSGAGAAAAAADADGETPASAGNAADGSERPVRTAKQQWKGLKSFFFSSQHGWGKADAGSNLRVENTVMVRDPASDGGGTPKWLMGRIKALDDGASADMVLIERSDNGEQMQVPTVQVKSLLKVVSSTPKRTRRTVITGSGSIGTRRRQLGVSRLAEEQPVDGSNGSSNSANGSGSSWSGVRGGDSSSARGGRGDAARHGGAGMPKISAGNQAKYRERGKAIMMKAAGIKPAEANGGSGGGSQRRPSWRGGGSNGNLLGDAEHASDPYDGGGWKGSLRKNGGDRAGNGSWGGGGNSRGDGDGGYDDSDSDGHGHADGGSDSDDDRDGRNGRRNSRAHLRRGRNRGRGVDGPGHPGAGAGADDGGKDGGAGRGAGAYASARHGDGDDREQRETGDRRRRKTSRAPRPGVRQLHALQEDGNNGDGGDGGGGDGEDYLYDHTTSSAIRNEVIKRDADAVFRSTTGVGGGRRESRAIKPSEATFEGRAAGRRPSRRPTLRAGNRQ